MSWWCEAYGPPDPDVPVDAWPRCFLSPAPGSRHCDSLEYCAGQMAHERAQVFARIQAGAAAGDPVMLALAEDFPTPESLLGGADADGA